MLLPGAREPRLDLNMPKSQGRLPPWIRRLRLRHHRGTGKPSWTHSWGVLCNSTGLCLPSAPHPKSSFPGSVSNDVCSDSFKHYNIKGTVLHPTEENQDQGTERTGASLRTPCSLTLEKPCCLLHAAHSWGMRSARPEQQTVLGKKQPL